LDICRYKPLAGNAPDVWLLLSSSLSLNDTFLKLGVEARRTLLLLLLLGAWLGCSKPAATAAAAAAEGRVADGRAAAWRLPVAA
jgi:hypothetical protein